MKKSTKTSKGKGSDFEVLQGGKLEESLVVRKFADVRRRWLAEINEETGIQREAAKHFKQIATSSNQGKRSDNADAIAELGRITERLAKRKLPVPRRVVGLPDVWGSYTLKFTPPYLGLGTSTAGQISSVTGSPTISATGVDGLGQLSCSVDTNFNKPSGGTASNLMGVHFRPMFSQAKARISFESEFAFSYYVNSIRNKIATARAQGLMQLFQFSGSFVQPALSRGAFIGFSMVAENELKFNFISQTGPTWFLEAPVSSANFYFVVVSLSCSANAAGWPGSLAGSRVMVTVPSISVTVTGTPVFEQ